MKSLYQKTLELLDSATDPAKEDKKSLREIAEGSGLPYDWLVGIKYDRFKNPSVNRVERLYEYLSGKKLSI